MNIVGYDLARLSHENIAKFLGYCRESDPFSRMLLFEYASNGTLYEHPHCKSISSISLGQTKYLHFLCVVDLISFVFLALDGEAAQFSWLRRMKIAIGIAQGLRYLHTESQPPFAISELNSNSVYVIEDSTPKVLAWLFCTN